MKTSQGDLKYHSSSPTCGWTGVHSHVLEEPLAAPRGGVMLHYDDSSDDEASIAWFRDARCSNGYTWFVLDDGRLIELADPAFRTPHAGACFIPRANSVFYGIAAATNGLVPATRAQVDTIIKVCTALFRYHRWTESEVRARIVGHDAQAIWTLEQTRLAGIPDSKGRLLWGKLDRKVPPDRAVQHKLRDRFICDARTRRKCPIRTSLRFTPPTEARRGQAVGSRDGTMADEAVVLDRRSLVGL